MATAQVLTEENAKDVYPYYSKTEAAHKHALEAYFRYVTFWASPLPHPPHNTLPMPVGWRMAIRHEEHKRNGLSPPSDKQRSGE